MKMSDSRMAMKLSRLICCELVCDTSEAPKTVTSTLPLNCAFTSSTDWWICSISLGLFCVSLMGNLEVTTTMASVPSLLKM